MTFQEFLNNAKKYLPFSKTPRLDLEILLCHVCNLDRAFLYANPQKRITQKQWDRLKLLVTRRKKGEPIAYLMGYQEFWSLNFEVSPDVLIPRADTEILVETALSVFSAKDSIKAADLGTGSGAIALALATERPHWKIYATDISLESLIVAKKNAKRWELNTITFSQGNWCKALVENDFNLILSNPPYLSESEWQISEPELKFEPKKALLAERQGLEHLEKIITGAKNHLKPQGYLMLEHGDKQGREVRECLYTKGYMDISTRQDLSGLERVTFGQIE